MFLKPNVYIKLNSEKCYSVLNTVDNAFSCFLVYLPCVSYTFSSFLHKGAYYLISLAFF